MLSIGSGHSADYLLDAVATGRESYYTNAVAEGEPAGRWFGAGAESLGLVGEVDPDVMRAVYGEFKDPRDPTGVAVLGHRPKNYPTAEEKFQKLVAREPGATPERREELASLSVKVPSNIMFHDLTFSPPKSVTVAHAAFELMEVKARADGDEAGAEFWGGKREMVEAALWEGNRTALNYMSAHSGYTRVGDHSKPSGRWTEAHDWTVASFFQHDSRNHDPQLHIHNAVLNKVQTVDGKWRTLDRQDLNQSKRAGGAVGERAMFEALGRDGFRSAMRPDGTARELVGVRAEASDHFSTRSQALTPVAQKLADEYEAATGRAPNTRQVREFKQRACLSTRPAKEHTAEDGSERLMRWDREFQAAIGSDLAATAHELVRLAAEPLVAGEFSVDAVVETSLAAAQLADARVSTSSVLAAVDAVLPDYLGGLSGDEVHSLLRGTTMGALASDAVTSLRAQAPGATSEPDSLKLDNGRSVFIQPESDLFATNEHVRSERALRAAAVERGAAAMSGEAVDRFVTGLAEMGIELGVDQAAAVRGTLTDGAKLSSWVGAAGAGKSFTLGVLAKAWTDPGLWGGEQHRVTGLATAQIAAEELEAVGLTTRNVAAWLAAQDRLADGVGLAADRELAVRAGDLVVLDESSMVDHSQVQRIRERVEAAGGKTLMTGDHRQVTSIGAGGSLGLVAATGMGYELTEVRRFNNEWEADASLRLREGDPGALLEYRKHGRVVDGGTKGQTEARAVRGYLGDYLAGRDTRLMVDTNEQAASLAGSVRAELVRLGRVPEEGVELSRHGGTAGVGDLVEARKLSWDLAGFEGNRKGPVNRERYTVTETRADGSVVVDHLGERLVLPAEYVRDHLSLGYANTTHAVQGINVDTGHSVATPRTGRASEYVNLTRGADNNTAYVETVSVPADSPPGAVHDAVHRDPVAVLGGALETEQPDRAAVEELEASELEMGSVMTAAERFAVIADEATAGRTSSWLDRLTDQGALTGVERQRLAADQGMSSLATILRQAEVAGHDPEQVLAGAVGERSLDGARSLASVLHDRITHNRAVPLEPKGESHAEWVPKVVDPAIRAHLQDLAQAADLRRDELGALAALEGPQWAVEALGPVPDVEAERGEWQRKAGIVAGHRERTGHTAEGEALPGPPRPGEVQEAASWWAGWRALGRPDRDAEEKNLSDGRLRVRVRAWEREKVWQPAYVARELSGTSQAVERARADAEIRRAEAAAAADVGERARLEAEATEAGVRAESLVLQARELEHADNVRASWYAHTAATRAADQRARLELASRGVDVDNPPDLTTARELLEAQSLGVEVDDLHRAVTDEHDLTDVAVARARDMGVFADRVPESVETNVPDVRDTAEPVVERELGEWTRVPDVAEVTEDVGRAQQALVEQQNREELDQRALEDERDRYVAEPDVAKPLVDQPEYVDVDQ